MSEKLKLTGVGIKGPILAAMQGVASGPGVALARVRGFLAEGEYGKAFEQST